MWRMGCPLPHAFRLRLVCTSCGSHPCACPGIGQVSSTARRLLQYRNWLDLLLERPRLSVSYDRDVFLTEGSLRDQAAFIIGWGC